MVDLAVAMAELLEVVVEERVKNKQVHRNAINFVLELPYEVTTPEVCAQIDGDEECITFDWFDDEKCTLSISVYESELVYATADNILGKCRFNDLKDNLPAEITMVLRKVHEYQNA